MKVDPQDLPERAPSYANQDARRRWIRFKDEAGMMWAMRWRVGDRVFHIEWVAPPGCTRDNVAGVLWMNRRALREAFA